MPERKRTANWGVASTALRLGGYSRREVASITTTEEIVTYIDQGLITEEEAERLAEEWLPIPYELEGSDGQAG